MTLATLDVIAFVSTTNPARAEKFYADALGLQLVNKSPFALVFDAHGTMLRVTVVEELHPAPNPALGWAVADISETARACGARGRLLALRRHETERPGRLAVTRRRADRLVHGPGRERPFAHSVLSPQEGVGRRSTGRYSRSNTYF
jgi:catechol 2,3-dioxygenase-like lactoylglutathione lyase family enzyme